MVMWQLVKGRIRYSSLPELSAFSLASQRGTRCARSSSAATSVRCITTNLAGPAPRLQQHPDLCVPARFGFERGDSADGTAALLHITRVRPTLVPVSAARHGRAEVHASPTT